MSLMDVFVKIGADTSELESGISKAKGLAGGLGNAVVTGMKVAGAAIGAATTAVTAFAASSVEVGKTFDASMSQVAATMGVTTDEIGKLRDFAQEMGRTTAFSATQAADALNYMALAGYDAETSMNMLPNVLNLAAAGSMELATASDMVTDAQTALGLSLEETTQLVDMMAKTSSKSNTSVQQLGDAILTIGGTAKNLAGGTTELNTALGILADNGIKGAEGGTHLRNAILSLSAPTDNAAAALKGLGIVTTDAEGNLRPLEEIMGDLGNALDGLGTAERADIISTIFNKTDIAAVNALIDTSAERWGELATMIDDSAGAAEKMAETQLDNLAGDITLFKSALEGAQLIISDALTPSIRNFVKFGTQGISRLSDAFEKGGFNGALKAFSDVLSQGISSILDKIPDITRAGVKLLTAFIKGFTQNKNKLKEAARKIITTITSTLAEEFPKFKNIFTNIQAGIEGVFGFIEKNGDAIKSILKGIFAGFMAYKAAISIFQTLEVGIIAVKTAAKLLNGELAITSMLNPYTAIAVAVGGLIGLMVTLTDLEARENQAYRDSMTLVSDEIKARGDAAAEYIDQLNTIYDSNKNVVKSIEDQYKEEENLKEELQGIVDENGRVREGYEERAAVILEQLAQAFDTEMTLQDGVIKNYDTEMEKIDQLIEKKKAEALISANQEAYSEALMSQIQLFNDMNAVQDEYNAAQATYEEALHKAFVAQDELNKAAERGSPMVGAYGQELQENTETMVFMKEKMSNLEEALNNTSQAYYANQDFLKDYNALIESTTKGTGDLSEAVTNMTNNIITEAPVGILKAQAEEAIEYLNGLLKAHEEGVSVTEEQIAEATKRAQEAVEALQTAGEDGKSGYANGLAETSDVIEAAQKMVDDGLEAVRTAQDSHSPSVVFGVEGTNALNGYIKAVESRVPALKDTVGKLINDIRVCFSNIVSDAISWGSDMMSNFINGIRENWEALKITVSEIAASVKDYLGFSEPKLGPLSDFHTYAPDMMDLFAQGVKDSEQMLLNTVSDAFDFSSLVTSPDNGNDGKVGGIGDNFVINVYGAQGMDEMKLARLVANEVRDQVVSIGAMA